MHKKHGFLDSIQVNGNLRQRGQRLHPEDHQDGTWIKIKMAPGSKMTITTFIDVLVIRGCSHITSAAGGGGGGMANADHC